MERRSSAESPRDGLVLKILSKPAKTTLAAQGHFSLFCPRKQKIGPMAYAAPTNPMNAPRTPGGSSPKQIAFSTHRAKK
jgi:hypothetical protein